MKDFTRSRLLAFFDYEGTLGTSIQRHYVQYCEALQLVAARHGMEGLAPLQPVSWEEFQLRYFGVKSFSEFVDVSAEALKGLITREEIDREYKQILWQYRPEHMVLEKLVDGAREAVAQIAPFVHCVMVSFTRQKQEDFVEHLRKLGLISENGFAAEDIYCVGTDGSKNSEQAKLEVLQGLFGTQIAEQRQHGGRPFYVGDAIGDMQAGLSAGLDFIGVTDTGKNRANDFELTTAIQNPLEIRVSTFPSVADKNFVNYVKAAGSEFLELS